ncbi:hypothetical protein GE09DRAFT_978418 [Coniochaeta sp. 2T2.1]|nr:hypothetical protein GE09DRAFT_978418 [Coniochaeta sp. 2T2.1]
MDKSHLAPTTPEQHHPAAGPSNESENDYFTAHAPSQPPTPMPDPVMAYGPKRKPCKLVLCFDGTGNKFRGDDSDSSILKIYRMLDRTATDQYHYYQPGIGTYVVTPHLGRKSTRQRLASWYAKTKDSMVGSSFDQHVVGGYRFLMRFYTMGDEIYIFGFSRGSYIARFLAEMLDYVGLLSHGNEEMVSFAWKAFSQWQCRRTDNTPEGVEKRHAMYGFLKGFRETFSRPVRRIRFLGLFDTVNSVPRFETAWMERSKFPYTARSSAKVIRHAVSIDERRAKFRQDLIYQSNNTKKQHHDHPMQHTAKQKMHDVHEKYRHNPVNGGTNAKDNAQPPSRGRNRLNIPGLSSDDEPVRYRARSRSTRHSRFPSQTRPVSDIASVATSHAGPPTNYADSDSDSDSSYEDEQDIEEVWFAGGHGDVGGGWEVPPEGKSASHIPLAWMVREAMRAGLGFDMEKVMAMGCAGCEDEVEVDEAGVGPPATGGEGEGEGGNHHVTAVPDITVRSPSNSSPTMLNKAHFGGQDQPSHNNGINPNDSWSDKNSNDNKHHHSPFHRHIHAATTAPLHDSLSFSPHLPFLSVLAWRVMEYLPFRRMDLRGDGSWKPIRWPLPCGEVRDIPHDARVHGSVIRRMMSDEGYRPGNLIVGGGGRGVKVAPKDMGIGDWVCVKERGDAVGEVWVRREVVEDQGRC